MVSDVFQLVKVLLLRLRPFHSFKKSNLRRTIVAAMPLTIQTFCGVYFVAGYLTYFIQLSGYTAQASFTLGIVQQILSMTGNMTSVSTFIRPCSVSRTDYIPLPSGSSSIESDDVPSHSGGSPSSPS
jgi:hypothetical protein